MNRKDLFACPFYFDKIELDKDEVETAIEHTGIAGAMSVGENVLDTNFKFLHDPIDKIVGDVMFELGFQEYEIFTSWMTKTVTGFRHGFDHMHCNSFLSGVLYLTDRASPLMFRHPLPWRWSTGFDDKNDGVLKSNQFVLHPEKGDIVLFPSHVFNIILPHKDPIPRCSIAFNVVPTGQYGASDSKINVSIHPNK